MTAKVALVTGAATGIGAEVARQLAATGAKVAVCDVNVAAGQAVADEIDGLFVECNVADFDAVSRAVNQCVEQLGIPDVAHLNAGVMTVPNDAPYLAIEEVSLEQYRRMISINLDGVFYGFKTLIPLMKPHLRHPQVRRQRDLNRRRKRKPGNGNQGKNPQKKKKRR